MDGKDDSREGRFDEAKGDVQASRGRRDPGNEDLEREGNEGPHQGQGEAGVGHDEGCRGQGEGGGHRRRGRRPIGPDGLGTATAR